jgi:metallo-beta-lactamase class B
MVFHSGVICARVVLCGVIRLSVDFLVNPSVLFWLVLQLPLMSRFGDGEVLKLGKTAIAAIATPGHTMGSMSWRWQACEGKVCKTIVFASSLNPVSADGYRFTSKAGAPIVAGFEASYRKMDATACDILISAHPDNAGPGRYNDKPGACRAYADRSRGLLAARLAKERAGPAK